MSHISTISELLQLSHCQYRIYDLGRKLDKIPKAQFTQIEMNMAPYPFPSQGHAFIGIAFWQKQSTTPYLWFVKLPLDERGLLNQGARNHFIAIIIEALGNDLSINPTEQQEELLKSNPYHFTPAQYKLAAINSLLKVSLKQPASQYYEACQHYFHGKNDWQQWQHLGVQGIADFSQRLTEKYEQTTNEHALKNALVHLPTEVLNPLSGGVENTPLAPDVISTIIELYHNAVISNEPAKQTCFLRMLASSSQHPYVKRFIANLLQTNKNSLHEDILITLAGRCWAAFEDHELLLQYLEVLASNQALFPAIFQDLVAIPVIRPILFQCMRSPSRSQVLASAIGALFNQQQANNVVH